MVGAVTILLVLVLIGPILVMFGGAIWAALFGLDIGDDVEHKDDHPAEAEAEAH
jgi:hypothetical protein